MPEEIKVVDAQFWTNWVADYVSGAIERREAAANRLITALGWFWSVYTATSLLGASLAETEFGGWSALLLLAPIVTLSAAYLCALWSLNPIVGTVTQTQDAAMRLWRQVLDQKLFRLRVASALLSLSVILIAAGAYVVATSAR